MVIDATFWVAISFLIFIGALVYLKIPQKINELLNKLILDIKNEIDESERLRQEAKVLLDSAQNKLDTAQTVSNDILQQAKKDSDHLIIEMNDKFHKSSEIKKSLAKNEIDESEKLRQEAKVLLDSAQNKLDTAQTVSNDILQQAKKDSDHLIIEMNDKFHKSSEIKKNLAENKISQMKEAALKEIKDVSIKIAVDSVKKIINTSVDKSKLDGLFEKNLEETKIALKKIS